MREVTEIKGELESLQSKLGTVDGRIDVFVDEIKQLKQSSAELLEQNLGKARTPASLSTQREMILKKSLEVDELKMIRPGIQNKIEQAKKQLEIVSHYADAEQYLNDEKVFFEKAEKLRQALSDLIASAHPLQKLESILQVRQVRDAISLEHFFEGEVEPVDGNSNEYFLEKRVMAYHQFDELLPTIAALLERNNRSLKAIERTYKKSYHSDGKRKCLLCGGDVTAEQTRRTLATSQAMLNVKEQIAYKEAEKKRLEHAQQGGWR